MVCPVIDLHCDLLAYLNEDRERNDPMQDESRCSLPLLEKGGVLHQVLAVFTETESGSRQVAEGQLTCYRELMALFPQKKTQLSLAVENASGLLEEDEPLEAIFSRFDEENWLYVSLTWNDENRFGGGNASNIGLKREGEIFLEYMDGKKTFVDLSHTSDALAEGILNHIHKKGLKLIPLASHSNFRAIKEAPRNLPDSFAQEIIDLGGLIGINFVRHFVGDTPEDFIKHIRHGLSLGGENALALGADFFGGIDLSAIAHLKPFFQEPFSDSSCYPRFYHLLTQEFEKEQVEKIFYKNAQQIAIAELV